MSGKALVCPCPVDIVMQADSVTLTFKINDEAIDFLRWFQVQPMAEKPYQPRRMPYRKRRLTISDRDPTLVASK